MSEIIVSAIKTDQMTLSPLNILEKKPVSGVSLEVWGVGAEVCGLRFEVGGMPFGVCDLKVFLLSLFIVQFVIRLDFYSN